MNATMKPRAWLCELAEEDGTTRTQFVEEDPAGLRWNDSGEPSPYRTTPLLTMEQAAQMVAAERERCAKLVQNMDTTGHDGYIETAGDLCEALAACIRRA